MRATWSAAPFENCIEPVEYTRKVQRNEFLESGRFPVISQESAFINGYWDDEADVFAVRTPVVLFGDHTKSLKYVDFDFVLGADGVKVLQPRPFLLPKFFYYALASIDLGSLGYARHYRLLKEQEISWPERSEQQRIVAVLDEAFAGIAAARANAERNLRNARALFESESEAVFAQAYDRGPTVPLAELATDITDGDHMPPPKSERGVPFVTIGNVDKQRRTLDFSGAFRVPGSYYDGLKANRKPRPGDVLYTVTGSFGIPVQVRDARPFCFQRHIGLVRPRADVDSGWLYHLLASPQVFHQADERATGTAQRTVSLQVLRSLRVPQVPLAEQKDVAARLNSLTERCARLGHLYERKLAALDELKRSLLHHAFTGQLTARAATALTG